MFKKWNAETDNNNGGGNGMKSAVIENKTEGETQVQKKTEQPEVKSPAAQPKRSNTILKGSKLTGDIHVTSDLELSGDVEGNIKSAQDSNIVLKGNCRGNIETMGGSVTIDGSVEGGNISAGKDVTIFGKFSGGEVKAKGKISVNGEFNGKLEAGEIEVGSNAHGKGELHYREFISISRGAKVEVQISQANNELKAVKDIPQKKVVEMKPNVSELKKQNEQR